MYVIHARHQGKPACIRFGFSCDTLDCLPGTCNVRYTV